MAAVPEGGDPAGVTNTWNEGPVAGAGAQRNAHPMFHGAAVVVNEGLVQLPVSWGEVTKTRAGPPAAVDDPVVDVEAVADPPGAVVVVDPPALVVVVVAEPPPATVVVVTELPTAGSGADAALGGGSFSFPEVDPLALEVPPVSPLIHIPKMTATRTAVKSCHVFQDRRSLILSSPGWGKSSDTGGTPALSEGDVTSFASNRAPV